ncbi:MAG: hypothetical protein GY696_08465 [Gammaproteobacteria bacterium]|nr:hypothetical protein [Gammaproteobacteria bacterium]
MPGPPPDDYQDNEEGDEIYLYPRHGQRQAGVYPGGPSLGPPWTPGGPPPGPPLDPPDPPTGPAPAGNEDDPPPQGVRGTATFIQIKCECKQPASSEHKVARHGGVHKHGERGSITEAWKISPPRTPTPPTPRRSKRKMETEVETETTPPDHSPRKSRMWEGVKKAVQGYREIHSSDSEEEGDDSPIEDPNPVT